MKAIIFTSALFSIINFTSAQVTVTGETFSRINLEGNGKIFLRQDSVCSITYINKSDQRDADVTVKNNTLTINGIAKDEIHLSMPVLEQVKIDGQGSVTGESHFNVNDVLLSIDGDGKISLDMTAKKVNAKISGNGKIILNGTSQDADYSIPGSGKIDAIALKTIRCNVDISGLGKCLVDVTDDLHTDISGTGTVNYKSLPKNKTENITGIGNTKRNTLTDTSTTDKPDTTFIDLGKSKLLYISSEKEKHNKIHKTKPIWAGFEMGINSYMDNGGTFTLSPGKENFDLRLEKSIYVGLNLVQTETEIAKSNVWLFTGLGITWNNYRFASNVVLENKPVTSAYEDTTPGVNHLKSKLVAVYLTVPVMFEVFTSREKKNAFHIGAGGMFGLRLDSHTKQKIEIEGDVSKLKDFNDYNLSTFRYGFRVAAGYGKFNVFADYYASTLFKENKGPVLYPVDAGITFIGF